MGEVQKGCYAGPFNEIPFEHFIQSPIGLVLKDHGKDVRLIFHLSYLCSGKSVNSETPQDLCSVTYPDISDAIRLCLELTSGRAVKLVFSGKSDFKSAFRNVPISKLDFMLLIMKAVNPKDGNIYYFVDKCLPFGASISCSLFQEFSDAVAHMFTYRTGKKMVNYLDDYYFVALIKSLWDGQIRAFLEICNLIGFPVSMDKTEWGTPVLIFLGFLIDFINQKIYISVEKIKRAIDLITGMLEKKNKKTTLHELQKLCRFQNHLLQMHHTWQSIYPQIVCFHQWSLITTPSH